MKKRKMPESSESDQDSEYDVEMNVTNIHPRKKATLEKLSKVP